MSKKTAGEKKAARRKKATKSPKRKVVRQLTVMEMSDGKIDINIGTMTNLEALGWIAMYVNPAAFLKTLQTQIQAKAGQAKK